MKIFHLPDLGEGLAEAEIREWYIKEGDEVQVDQPLVSMETAKAIVDVPSPYAGKIQKLHGKVNDIIKTGSPLISFDIETDQTDKKSVVGSLEETLQQWPEEIAIAGRAEPKNASIKAMPAARLLAKEMNVDLQQVTPSGPQGLITPADVKQFMNQQKSLSKSIATDHAIMQGKIETLHGVRRAMALSMRQSHQDIVPVTIIEDADISHWPDKIDMTVHLLKALVAASKLEPGLNSWFDGHTLQKKICEEINVALAIDTSEGLFVPVIRDVAAQSDTELRQQIDQFKTEVKDRSIKPTAMQDATITLSNFGTICGRYATPIIVPPTVTIVGCGRSRAAPLIRNGIVEVGRILPISLSFDHRAVTGGEATRFLKGFIDQIEAKG